MVLVKEERLTEQDLNRWRLACARRELVENQVVGLSLDVAERYIIDYYRLLGELAQTYNLDDSTDYVITAHTGAILYDV